MQKNGISSPEDEENGKVALPLKGIKVLDLSRVLAGPWATMSLADLGAEVWKIENIEGGDDTRAWATPNYKGVSAYYLCANRGNPIARNMHDPDVLLPSVGGADALRGCRPPDSPARRAPGPVPSKVDAGAPQDGMAQKLFFLSRLDRPFRLAGSKKFNFQADVLAATTGWIFTIAEVLQRGGKYR